MAPERRWVTWHERYEDPASALSHRLRVVQRRLAQALDEAREGPLQLISMCAGQGLDVIGVLASHPCRTDVRALLVELEPNLVTEARARAANFRLPDIEVLQADASTTTAYRDAVPADVVLVCGVFGNISNEDCRNIVFELPRLSGPDATVIWTRHRRPPDLTPTIRGWFAVAGFREVAFDTQEGEAFSVGTHRLTIQPKPFQADRRLFTFR